jgi:predicted ATPase
MRPRTPRPPTCARRTSGTSRQPVQAPIQSCMFGRLCPCPYNSEVIIESVRVTIPKGQERDWPFCLAPVRQIARDDLDFVNPITFLVGENGSGKSTLIEAIAEAYGLDVRGGHGGRRYAPPPHAAGKLAESLGLRLTSLGSRTHHKKAQGFFLRAETALGVFEYMSDHEVPGYGETHLGSVSHGEGFLQVFRGRFTGQGLYLMDEPEAALSFQSCVALMTFMGEVVRDGSQIICATHSPLLAALQGATIWELDNRGMHVAQWAELALVRGWRQFMSNPERYLYT